MVKAVIYCRVSTDDEIQINALDKQIEEAKEVVKQNGWILVDEYVDEGKTGTTTKKRDEYNRLVSDLELNKFDVIVIKSQDRLMRSTKDWYIFIDKLVQNNKRLFFYLENKFYSSDDALITGIKAILAEEYSRELSKKINNAHRNRQKNKGNLIITSNTWGYDNINKQIVINQDEAEIVKMIFDLYVEGFGIRTISNILTNNQIYSRTGKQFPDSTLRNIIRNPLYKGMPIMNRAHYNFDSKSSKLNDESEWIYKHDETLRIIDDDTWNKANKIMDEKCRINKVAENRYKRIGVKNGTSPLSGKIICGECGNVYWRRRYNRVSKQIIVWSCKKYVISGRKTDNYRSRPKNQVVDVGHEFGCDNIHVKDEDLNNVLLQCTKKIYTNKDKILVTAIDILNKVLNNDSVDDIDSLNRQIEELKNKQEILLDKFLDGTIQEELYEKKNDDLQKKIDDMNQRLEKEEIHLCTTDYITDRVAHLKNEIEHIIDKDLSLQFVYEHIEKIIVHPTRLEILFDVLPHMEFEVKKINYRKTEYICL